MFFNVKSKKLILKIDKNFILNFLQKILWTPPPGSAPARFYTKSMKMFYAPLYPSSENPCCGPENIDMLFIVHECWQVLKILLYLLRRNYVLFRTANNNVEGWTVMICIVFFFNLKFCSNYSILVNFLILYFYRKFALLLLENNGGNILNTVFFSIILFILLFFCWRKCFIHEWYLYIRPKYIICFDLI